LNLQTDAGLRDSDGRQLAWRDLAEINPPHCPRRWREFLLKSSRILFATEPAQKIDTANKSPIVAL
jgi:hypothetical protein